MKLKLSFVISLLLIFMPSICMAKTIKIDRKNYNTDSILEQDGFIYNAIEDTLILENANLETISISSDLKIILKGENSIKTNLTENFPSIEAKNLVITGDGLLNIDSSGIGVKSTILNIIDTNLNINSSGYNFISKNDIKVSNSILNVSSDKNSIFNPVDSNIYLNNSQVIVHKTKDFINGFGHEMYVDNSDIEILEGDSFRNNFYNTYISGNSKIYCYCKKNQYWMQFYKIMEDDFILMGSNDNQIYYDVTNYNDVPIYTRIVTRTKDKIDDLSILKDEICKKEEDLLEKEQELSSKEQELNQLKQELSSKEQELSVTIKNLVLREEDYKNQKEELDLKNKELQERIDIIKDKEKQNNIFESSLNYKEKETKSLQDDYLKDNSELNNLREYLKIKELDLKQKEQELVLKLDQLNNQDDNNQDKNLGVEEEKTKYGEVLEDELLENLYEYNKTTSNNIKSKIKYIISLILSFIGGGLTILFLKRWRILNG